MCGITGWVSFESDLTGRQQVVDAMTETMSCRGPDDVGVRLWPHAALGHRRLAIIDLPGGRQPMSVDTPGGAITIVYSGETYNYAELRAELAGRGHRFRTDSDTEVVLRAYLEWGEALVDRLNGMYAFAIWDQRTEQLLMVRDRMGIKPFYYFPTPDGVLFGSEPKAILANPLASRTVDLDGLRELFCFTKAPGWALWQGMSEVLPGTLMTVDRNGIRSRTYWRLRAVEHTDGRDDTVARVRELLTDIVDRQLVADVPRCVLLSGGLDSSAITGLAAARLQQDGERVRTFSVDFVDQERNFVPDDFRGTPDSPFVREVAQLVGSKHQDVILNPEHLADPEVRRRVIGARDIPAGLGDLDNSLFLLFSAIRAESTVALSGESADEVFGGYSWFHDDVVRKADTFPWMAFDNPLSDAQRTFVNPDLLPRLRLPEYAADQYATAVGEVEHLGGEDELEYRMRTICHLHLTRFVRMLLDRKDRMSMAVGLEVRVPFCDHRLVEYVYNTPWSLKTFDGREKSLLRHATAHVLPRSVVERVKSPYPSTQDPGYAANLQRQAKEILDQRNSLVFDLVDRDWVTRAAALDPVGLDPAVRTGLDHVIDLYTWVEMYAPSLRLD
ncbi:asparagine synthase (glutamine-hydrolyzing) [Nocardia stercoris]|uniref:asparagine synthase (glutamine-hydrolyzing) n=1 Tax=Nocardia stercoris TaxID=2483361 RepID=A0A3M2KYF4_9NOCA|nr:asparagine synthase (glutamine-hydrolyzing) [Nocardia stercoris]RMI30527.1 asparagine synthase (glutamine-hydrolyzing) [Nocardia stercoris]